jgi:pyruvate dehydrogenase E2 component (dihydrolipoamide acetyltransferase)
VAQTTEIQVLDIGGAADAGVIEVLVREGQTIAIDAPLITLETEKATMDVPSPLAGRVARVLVKKGDKVAQGSVILLVESAAASAGVAAAAPASPPAAPPAAAPVKMAPAPAPAPTAPATPAPRTIPPGAALAAVDEMGFSRAYASPSVRKFARELGVDLGKVKGTAAKQRITHDDVKAYVKQLLTAAPAGASALPKIPQVNFAQFGEIDVRPLTRIQRISGTRLQASWINLPHVTQHEEADITDLEVARAALRSKASQEGVKLTPLAFIVKASALALQEFPRFNSSLDATAENLVFKKYFNIGFAADTPNGLVVPVIKGADRLNLFEIARSLAQLSEKARAGKLTSAEMQGGTFTISSLGGIGGTAFTPIINAPEVAILGVSRSSQKPVYLNGAFQPRLMLPLSLSYDHRVVDGADAARFVVFLSKALADPKVLM